MKYVKIVRQGGAYNNKTNDHPTYVLIDVETSNQSNMFFDSYAEAKKYCVKKGFEVVNQKYSLDWDFDLKKVRQFLENYKKVKTMQKRTKLTETQLKVKKLITPYVKNLVMEASAQITKKFMPTDGQLPTNSCDVFLIAKNGNYYIGAWNAKTQKLEKVGDWLRHYGELPITNFTHYAV